MDRETFIQRATTKPTGLSLNSDVDLYGTWGSTGLSRSRDSEPLTNVNFDAVSDDLLARFPNSFQIHRFNHWACGWGESLFVKMDDEEAIDAVLDWCNRLENYPVADEQRLSDVEDEIKIEAWGSYLADNVIAYILTNAEDDDQRDALKEHLTYEVEAKDLRKQYLDLGGCESIEGFSVYLDKSEMNSIAQSLYDTYSSELTNGLRR
jgi:hypothetical protein